MDIFVDVIGLFSLFILFVMPWKTERYRIRIYYTTYYEAYFSQFCS